MMATNVPPIMISSLCSFSGSPPLTPLLHTEARKVEKSEKDRGTRHNDEQEDAVHRADERGEGGRKAGRDEHSKG